MENDDMQINVKLIRKETIASGTMAFHFSKPRGFEFRAGQFADYTLIDPPETDTEGNTRGLSLVQAPFEEDLVAATRKRDTAFKRVQKDLPIGSEIKLDAPYGDFSLHKTQSTRAVFITGGIGVTPVRSMIAQATHDKTAHEITLLHVSRTPADLPLKGVFEQLARDNSNFTYVMTFESALDGWKDEHGRVDAAMVKRHVPDLHKPIFYLSSPDGMVKAMRALLVGLEINEDNIRTEEFSGY
ncbi:hypothetical protein GCM10028797_14640 [Dyella agri]